MDFLKSFELGNFGSILFSLLVLAQIFSLLRKTTGLITADSIRESLIYRTLAAVLTFAIELIQTCWFFLYLFFFGAITEEANEANGALNPGGGGDQQATGNPSTNASKSARSRNTSGRRSSRNSLPEGNFVRRLRSGTIYGAAPGPTKLSKKRSQTLAITGTTASARDSRVNAASRSGTPNSDLEVERYDSAHNNSALETEGKIPDEVLKYGRPRAALRNPSTIRNLGNNAHP